MTQLSIDDLREAIELLAIAITADLPPPIRYRIADCLQHLGEEHRTRSPSAGMYAITLSSLLRSLPPSRQ